VLGALQGGFAQEQEATAVAGGARRTRRVGGAARVHLTRAGRVERGALAELTCGAIAVGGARAGRAAFTRVVRPMREDADQAFIAPVVVFAIAAQRSRRRVLQEQAPSRQQEEQRSTQRAEQH